MEKLSRRAFLAMMGVVGTAMIVRDVSPVGEWFDPERNELDPDVKRFRTMLLTAENTLSGRETFLHTTVPLLSSLLGKNLRFDFAVGDTSGEQPYGVRILQIADESNHNSGSTSDTQVITTRTEMQSLPLYRMEVPIRMHPRLIQFFSEHRFARQEKANRYLYDVPGVTLSRYFARLRTAELIEQLVYGNQDRMVNCSVAIANSPVLPTPDVVDWYTQRLYPSFNRTYLPSGLPLFTTDRRLSRMKPVVVSTTIHYTLDAAVINPELKLAIASDMTYGLPIYGDGLVVQYERANTTVHELLSLTPYVGGREGNRVTYSIRTPKRIIDRVMDGLYTFPFRFPLPSGQIPGVTI